LCQNRPFYASTFFSERYDAGDKFGYLKANIELSLTHLELAQDMKSYLIQLGENLKSKGTP
jgi:UTP--glucose-1-phosphate uridylyltransferase